MKTPQKVLESVNRTVAEEIDYSQVTDEDLAGMVQEVRRVETMLNTILYKSEQAAAVKRFDLFVDIANGR